MVQAVLLTDPHVFVINFWFPHLLMDPPLLLLVFLLLRPQNARSRLTAAQQLWLPSPIWNWSFKTAGRNLNRNLILEFGDKTEPTAYLALFVLTIPLYPLRQIYSLSPFPLQLISKAQNHCTTFQVTAMAIPAPTVCLFHFPSVMKSVTVHTCSCTPCGWIFGGHYVKWKSK